MTEQEARQIASEYGFVDKVHTLEELRIQEVVNSKSPPCEDGSIFFSFKAYPKGIKEPRVMYHLLWSPQIDDNKPSGYTRFALESTKKSEYLNVKNNETLPRP